MAHIPTTTLAWRKLAALYEREACEIDADNRERDWTDNVAQEYLGIPRNCEGRLAELRLAAIIRRHAAPLVAECERLRKEQVSSDIIFAVSELHAEIARLQEKLGEKGINA